MKHVRNYLLILIASTFALASCSEDLQELDKGEDILTLSASCTETLSELNSDSDGASFSWSKGSNRGTGSSISYTMEFAKAGTGFATPYSVPMGQGTYSISYTESDFNDLLTEDLGLEEGASVSVDVRVTADVYDGSVDDQTADTTLTVTTYKPVSRTLYLIGDATPNGWSADNATEMAWTAAGKFSWTGKMTQGNFKFITTLGSFLPSYNHDTSGSGYSLVYRDSDGDPDEQFQITEPGSYTITADLLNLVITVEKGSEPPFDMIYFVGSFTGWSFVEMTKDPTNPFVFRYGAVLDWNDGGEFKFGTKKDDWSEMYHPTIEEAPYTHSDVMLDDTGDYKWFIPEADCGKPYKMALDITPGSESLTMEVFVPYEGIYMVGDATPNGWSIDDATAMTAVDDYDFTWTGDLAAGELKFTCDKKSDWMGAWFMASENDKEFVEGTETVTFVDKQITGNGDIDRKWKVSDAGNYTIVLNQLTETMTVKKNY
ncbi:MAG: SusF/SusE family outer membrane protein [Bacteroidales bacterium]|jgi:hypothetical protein|nr:SusF/SusE family outer membrane protein [Bacteroidales bacterium]MCI2121676.1 SusF/SusE family outer membrane protein [Bacteroidales bacterium]MCI2144641.1 SusF/SusE family outer membrane protein [Bacteroidales bacterium]